MKVFGPGQAWLLQTSLGQWGNDGDRSPTPLKGVALEKAAPEQLKSQGRGRVFGYPPPQSVSTPQPRWIPASLVFPLFLGVSPSSDQKQVLFPSRLPSIEMLLLNTSRGRCLGDLSPVINPEGWLGLFTRPATICQSRDRCHAQTQRCRLPPSLQPPWVRVLKRGEKRKEKKKKAFPK